MLCFRMARSEFLDEPATRTVHPLEDRSCPVFGLPLTRPYHEIVRNRSTRAAEIVTLVSMTARENMAKALVQIGKVMFGAAGLAFFVGGGLVSRVAQMDHLSGELIGIGFSILSAAVGGTLYLAGDRLQERWKIGTGSGLLSLDISAHDDRDK